MDNGLFGAIYNPDVLSCLANLSNDEVFTPPEVVNQMLDMLPQELFSNPDTTFLDPACKTGVFLREIAKRLITGLEQQIPDLQERIDHIFQKQLYGIAITELTSLLSRRGVYCSKYPNSEYSVSKFDDKHAQGNIRFKRIQHGWQKGKCVFCGASKSEYERGEDLETHAYEWIHTLTPERIFDMKFDVIIGNPPYQISDGGGMGTSAVPLYDKFVQQAKKLKPRYLSMIIPARWYAGGKGLDVFRTEMLNDGHITELHDFFDSTECFPGVDISGGVCYFLWERDNIDDCNIVSIRGNNTSSMKRSLLEQGSDTFIRFNEAVSIIRKIKARKEASFMDITSPRKPFGLSSTIKIHTEKKYNDAFIYAYPQNGYISKNEILQNSALVDKYKVFIAKAYGERGDFPYLVIGKPFVGKPETCCSETYLTVGSFSDEETAKNVVTYMTTKFFRFLVLIKKNTQNAPRGVYQFVPLQDFSKPWTDEELYAKYGITDDEIAFIDSMIRPMDLDGDGDGN